MVHRSCYDPAVGRGPTLPASPRRLEARRRYRRKQVVRGLTSSETWVLVALGIIVLAIALWILAYFLDSLEDPVRAALDLVRLGPTSRGSR
jgi:hypothetical protein